MIDLFQLPVPTGYELQTWLVSSIASGLMLLKGAMWVKGWKNGIANSSNGAKLLLSESEGEFRGTIKTLMANQVSLLKKMHECQKEDRDTWSPILRDLLSTQKSMSKMLENQSTLLIEHDKREQKVWEQMLIAIEAFQFDTQEARNKCFEKFDHLSRQLNEKNS